MIIQAPLCIVEFVQVIADKRYTTTGIHVAVDIIFVLIVYTVVYALNSYLVFLYFYYGKNGKELHENFKEGIRAKKEGRANGRLDEFGRPMPDAQVPAQDGMQAPMGNQGPHIGGEDVMEQQQVQMAIQESMKDGSDLPAEMDPAALDAQIAGTGNNVQTDQPPPVAPPQADGQVAL